MMERLSRQLFVVLLGCFFCLCGCEQPLHPYHMQLAVRGTENAEGSREIVAQRLEDMKRANQEMTELLAQMEMVASQAEAARDRCEEQARKKGVIK